MAPLSCSPEFYTRPVFCFTWSGSFAGPPLSDLSMSELLICAGHVSTRPCAFHTSSLTWDLSFKLKDTSLLGTSIWKANNISILTFAKFKTPGHAQKALLFYPVPTQGRGPLLTHSSGHQPVALGALFSSNLVSLPNAPRTNPFCWAWLTFPAFPCSPTAAPTMLTAHRHIHTFVFVTEGRLRSDLDDSPGSMCSFREAWKLRRPARGQPAQATGLFTLSLGESGTPPSRRFLDMF